MKLISLKVQSFKNLNADVQFDGKSAIISGKNGAGKSSAIDAVLTALGRLGTIKEPIQKGKKNAETTVEIVLDKDYTYKNYILKKGNVLKCTRTWDEKSTKLNVYLEGMKLSSPKELLETIVGIAAIPDPTEMINMTPAEQKAFLESIMAIDTSGFDHRKQEALAKVKRVESTISFTLTNLGAYSDVPDEPLTERSMDEVAELQRTHAEEVQRRAKIDTDIANGERSKKEISADIEWDADTVSTNETKIQQLQDEIKRLTEEKHQKVESIKDNIDRRFKIDQALTELKSKRDAFQPIDNTELMKRINEITGHNELYKRQLTKNDLKYNLKEQREVLEQYKADVAAIDQERIDILKQKNLPAGLEFTDDGVLYEGLPVTEDQLSEAKRLLLWVNILIAMHPNLRLIYLKHGSALDDESLSAVLQAAEKDDYQVLIEKVSNEETIQFTLIEKEPKT